MDKVKQAINSKAQKGQGRPWAKKRQCGYDIIIISRNNFEKLKQDLWPCDE